MNKYKICYHVNGTVYTDLVKAKSIDDALHYFHATNSEEYLMIQKVS